MNDSSLLQNFLTLFSRENLASLITIVVLIMVCVFLENRVRLWLKRLTRKGSVEHQFLSRLARTTIFGFALIAVLNQIGLDLKVLLIAAGVLILVAAIVLQRSIANLLGGLSVRFENPLMKGETISVSEHTGEVVSTDLFSTQIRTENNLVVRIPNKSLASSIVIRHSQSPICRLEFQLSFSRTIDFTFMEQLVRAIVARSPLALSEPDIEYVITGLTEHTLQAKLQLWTLHTNTERLQNDLCRELKRASEEAKAPLLQISRVK